MLSLSRKSNILKNYTNNELECLKNGYQDLKTVSNAKDEAVRHIMALMKDQETNIVEFKLKTKRSFEGKLDLADFKTFGFKINTDPKIVYVNKNEETVLKVENTELRLKQLHIDNELTSLKGLYKELTDKWRAGLILIEELKYEKEALINSYEAKIK